MSSASVAAVDHFHLASAAKLRSAAASLALLSYMQGGLEECLLMFVPDCVQDYMQLPDIFSTNSLHSTGQASEDDLLQSLYAQLGANPAPQAPASNPTHTSGPPFAENDMRPPLYAPGNADAQAASDGQVAYSQALTHTQNPGPAQGGPDYQSLSQHLTDLERSIQSLKNQGMVHHLEAQEVLKWQRHFPETEPVCKPMLPVAPLQGVPDFEDHSRLDPAHQVAKYLTCLTVHP